MGTNYQEWYLRLATQSEVYGPYSPQQIITFYQQGKINKNCYISRDKTQWDKVFEVLPIFESTDVLNCELFPDLASSSGHTPYDEESSFFANPIGSSLAHYQILDELGRGGMGVVYKVKDLKLNRTCALKVVHEKELNDDRNIKRFVREARSIGHLQHPNIVAIYEILTKPCYMFAMEYVEGQTLQTFMKSKTFDVRAFAKLMYKVCEALEYAHDNNVIHRDLKPENIMISSSGEPKVMDFGIAKRLDIAYTLSRKNEIIGTPHYIPLEILSDGKADQRSDIYSLGVIIYQALAGRTPFDGNATQIFFQMMHENVTPPSQLNPKTNKDLEMICLKCIEKKAEDRFSSVKLLKEEIERFLNNKPLLIRSPGITTKVYKWCQRNPLPAILLSVIVVSIVSTIYVLFENGRELQFKNAQLEEAQKIKDEALQQKKQALEESQYQLAVSHLKMAEYHGGKQFYKKAKHSLLTAQKIIKNSQFKDKKQYLAEISMDLQYTISPVLPQNTQQLQFFGEDAHFSSNGEFIMLRRRDTLLMWKINSPELLGDEKTAFRKYQLTSAMYKVSSDGKQIAYAQKGFLAIAYIDDGKVHKRIAIDGEIVRLNWSPNSNFIGVGVDHRNAGFKSIVVNVDSGKKWTLSEVENDTFLQIKFSPDSSLAVGVSRTNLIVMDLKTGKSQFFLYVGSSVSQVVFGPQNKIFVGDKTGNISVLHPLDKKKQRDIVFAAHSQKYISHLVVSNDLRLFVTVAEKEVAMWDAMTHRKLFSFTSEDFIRVIGFDDTSKHIHVLAQAKNTGRYQKWRIEPLLKRKLVLDKFSKGNFDEILRYISHADHLSASSIAISPSLRYLALSYLCYLFVWDLQNDEFFYTSNSFSCGELRSICFSPDEQYIAYAFNKGRIEWQSLHSKKIQYILTKRNNDGLTFLNNSTLIFSRKDGIFTCDINSKNIDVVKKSYREIHTVQVSPDLEWVVVGMRNAIEIWRKNQQNTYESKIQRELNFPVTSCAWSSDSNYFVASYRRGPIAIFEKKHDVWQLRKEFTNLGYIENVSISPNGEYLCIFERNQIFIYSIDLGIKKSIFTGYFSGFSANFDLNWKCLALPHLEGGALLFDFPFSATKK